MAFVQQRQSEKVPLDHEDTIYVDTINVLVTILPVIFLNILFIDPKQKNIDSNKKKLTKNVSLIVEYIIII